MKDGFIRVASSSPAVRVADTQYNSDRIIELIKKAHADGAKILVMPELCLTGYTCGDLFRHQKLISGVYNAIKKIADATNGLEILVFFGAPVLNYGKLYNCAVAVSDGEILGIVPKSNIPNYNEFYELRHFTPAPENNGYIEINGESVPFGTKLLFRTDDMPDLCVAAEICEDLWVPNTPSSAHACAGANVIVNLSASDETVGKDEYRRILVQSKSAQLMCAYIYADAGKGESTTDLVFSAHNLIGENGNIVAESEPFADDSYTASEIDIQKLCGDRRNINTFPPMNSYENGYTDIFFTLPLSETKLTRKINPRPFIPSDSTDRAKRCRHILDIQAHGLIQRIERSFSDGAVVAVSGGLDSCLALLVTVRAFDKLGRDRSKITTVSMPCFGTTKRTKSNSETLCNLLGTTFRCIDIAEAVNVHFRDIGHSEENHNVVFENSQARERTQIIMDIANGNNSLVIGTGDLSELALGWATYNGDHMSMYGVNASVPKTLVRHIVSYCADEAEENGNSELSKVLRDILATPVSPELLPAKDGEISQKTEELVGPYDLHDFFLYNLLRYGFSPSKIFRLACAAFEGEFDKKTILKWLEIFTKRFFSQQFKRSCLPDGPKVGSIALSPRGDLRMPSDASSALWLDEIKQIKID